MDLLRKLHQQQTTQDIVSEGVNVEPKQRTADNTDVLQDPIYGLKKTDTKLINMLRWMKKHHPDQYNELTSI